MYALNLDPEGRVLCAVYPEFAQEGAVMVAELPEGDVSDYRLVNGELVFEPAPKEEVPEEVPLADRVAAIEAQFAWLKTAYQELLSR